MENAEKYPMLARNAIRMKAFAEMIHNFIEFEKKESLPDFFEKVFDMSGYRTMLEEAGKEEADRLDNIKELISQAITYTEAKREELMASGELEEIEAQGYGNKISSLTGFLEEVALISDIDNYDESADAVTLMTIHSAKGLEFPVVFLPGMEENLFPSRLSADKPEELEEERRLAYVAVTRAKERVFITYAKERLLYGRTGFNDISRFAGEIPKETVEHIRIPDGGRRRVAPSFGSQKRYPPKISLHSELATDYITASARTGKERENGDFKYTQVFKQGDMIEHPNFGEGLIIKATDLGGDTLYEVAFDTAGTKKIMGTYAKFKMKKQ
jgi:DNA helicase-2/ATP-dependent DNA helicase PcrA